MKKSTFVTFLIYGSAVALFQFLITFAVFGSGFIDAPRVGNILLFVCSYLITPISFLLALNALYKKDTGERGAGAVFLGATIFVGIGFILDCLRYSLSGGVGAIPLLIFGILKHSFIPFAVLLIVATISAQWRLFKKAGKPGWASIVPIYNLIVQCQIAGAPGWWVIMFFVPIANIVFLIMLLDRFVKSFGKDSGFTVGMIFLRSIFSIILGYGNAKYLGQQVNK